MDNKPKFHTLLRQAREQCMKEFDAYEMQTQGNMIVKFFASGMEYRLSHEHNVAERTFLSSGRTEFLMGYLQGKNADSDMIEAIWEEWGHWGRGNSLSWADVFTKGLFYEESILEPHKNILDKRK